MKTRTVRLVAVIGALAVVAVIVPAGRAVFNGVTDNDVNSFASAADFNTNPSFRVVTYEVKTGAGFTGTTYLLTLNQDLVADYFVLLRGAAGDYTSVTDRGPDANYARIDQDPFANFTAGSSAANQLRLARGGATGTWTGQVTVVECIADCAASGFTLVRANEVTMTIGQTSATDTTGGSWGSGNLAQIGLYGGSRGGGMETDESLPANHKTGWARIWPSGADTVNLSRSNTGPGAINGTTTFSVYVVQWGSGWTIQRARVQGSAGGDGMTSITDYDTATITSVNRADTWVVAYGQVDDNTLAAGWDGTSFTLGDGVNVNATETKVAVGAEVGAQRDVEVYIHTQPDLFNQYVFGPDGSAPGIISGNLSGTATILGPKSPEIQSSSDTAGRRFPLVANTSNDAGGGGGGGSPTIEQTVVGGDDRPADTTLVTDTSLTNVNGDLYIAMIATKPDDKNITSVTGMGLTWTEDTSLNQCGARGQLEGYIYTATGDGGSNGVVTATLADAPTTSAIVVHRITGQHATAPIQATQTANTNGEGGACSGGTDGTPWDVDETTLFDDSLLLGFAASKSNKAPYTVDAPWVDIGYKTTVDGGSDVAIQYSSRTTTTAGLFNYGGDWNDTTDWTAHWIEVRGTGSAAVPAYPRSIVWGQLDADTTARWQRSRSGEPGTYWLQTPDFGDIGAAGPSVPDLQQLHYRWRNDDGPETGGALPLQATATADSTTTSATDVAVAGMTLTPGAGDYLVWFSGSVEGSADDSTQNVSIYVNGVQVAHSERQIFTESSIPDTSFPVASQALVTGLGAGETIEVRWRTTDGTATIHERTLVVQEITPADVSQATATADSTTTSATDVAVAGMTLTPGAGDYLVWFSGSVEGSADDSTQNVSIYVNGVQLAHTERQIFTEGSIPDTSFPVASHALVTGLGAGETIDVRWRTTDGTATIHERTLVVQAINPADISQATATADTTTTSGTDVVVAGMTLTPGAGDYLIWFSSSVEDTENDTWQYVSIYVNGVQVAHTERQSHTEGSLRDTSFPVPSHALVTGLGAGDTIDVRWRTTGVTATMHERTLVAVKLTTGAGATWAAAEDTALGGLAKSTTKRLRMLISNDGDASGSVLYRLEVSNPNPVSCDNAGTTWTRIDASTHWDMVTSSHFADGDPTSNISPGLADPAGKTFFAGELQESPTDETSGIALSGTQFTEIEYAVQATTNATDGAVYCFRLTDAGNPTNFTYTETTYGKVTLS